MPQIEAVKVLYLSSNVYEESIKRIEYLFSEFSQVNVFISGGKDSTVIMHLALEVARKLKRLPLNVVWIDQEAEWGHTVEYVKSLKSNPEIKLSWYQVPLLFSNAIDHSTTKDLLAWDPSKENEWIREKEEGAIHENVLGTMHGYKIFDAIAEQDFEKNSCFLGGIRCEESPGRRVGLIAGLTYKWITWGKKLGKSHYTFYPIYDWTWGDVWKYIHENALPYNKVYDFQYQYGLPVRDMRVSSLTHETALKNLFYLPEVDLPLYNALQKRFSGINAAVNMAEDVYIDELPIMFGSWLEYRDFLLEKLVQNEEGKENMRSYFRDHTKQLDSIPDLHSDFYDRLYKIHVKAVICNDTDCMKLKNASNGYLNGLLAKHGVKKSKLFGTGPVKDPQEISDDI